MSKQTNRVMLFLVPNTLLYGSILLVCGIFPLVGYLRAPSDVPLELWGPILTFALFTCAFICGRTTYLLLLPAFNHELALLWTQVPLFFAPFTSLVAAFVVRMFHVPEYVLYALPVGFILPFFILVGLAIIRNYAIRQGNI
jgi:hypothetical protein